MTLKNRRYPFSVNTDDPGVFDTDLSAEYAHIAGSHGMDKSKMANLACRAVQVGVRFTSV